MKKSTIIATSFATLVLASILVLYTDAKNHLNYKDPNIDMKTFPLTGFSVIVAGKGADVHVDYAKKNAIEVEYLKNKMVKKPLYKLRNDTLFVYGGLRTFVKISNLKSIRAHKTYWLGVGTFNLDSLRIDIAGGEIQFYGQDKFRSNIKNLTINASDSAKIIDSGTKIDKLTLQAGSDSDCRFWGECKHIEAKISDETVIQFYKSPISVKYEGDYTSKIKIRDGYPTVQ